MKVLNFSQEYAFNLFVRPEVFLPAGVWAA
jgi:hypothetical protein